MNEDADEWRNEGRGIDMNYREKLQITGRENESKGENVQRGMFETHLGSALVPGTPGWS